MMIRPSHARRIPWRPNLSGVSGNNALKLSPIQTEKQVNPHFEEFLFDWSRKEQFLVGGYGSSKSYHTALKIIFKLLEERRTALVVRDVYETIRDSCFSLFEELVNELGLGSKIKCKVSPLKVVFKNGSVILFKGLDKPQKLKSINNVSLIWLEEASEIKYGAYKELLGRLRHPSLRTHLLLTTNPVSKSNWTYKHFFAELNSTKELKAALPLADELYKQRILKTKKTYYHHSTINDNLFLPPSFIKQLDEFAHYDPDLYRNARLGRYGVIGRRVLPQFEVRPRLEVFEAVSRIPQHLHRVGMDFGFEDSYNAVIRMAIDDEHSILYLYWEYYKNKMTDDKTAEELVEFKESQELIRADGAEPKAIAYYQQMGFHMVGAAKPTRLSQIRKVKRFKRIVCADHLLYTIAELSDLVFAQDRDGNLIEDKFNIDPHTFSAIWYGLDGYEVADLKDYAKYRLDSGGKF